MKFMLGEEGWAEALKNSKDGYRGAMKEFMKTIEDDSVSMYSDW
jgi:hypothetical protein